MSKEIYDVAVVGSGAAGLSAAIRAAHSGLKTLVLQGFGAGGRLVFADEMEGYPGAEWASRAPGGRTGWRHGR